MGFRCGIIGLPNVGKSTLFNALTESNNAEVVNYPFTTIEPNIGRVAIPDKRLEIVSDIVKSKKIIPTYIDFVDIAGLVKGASKGEGLGNKFLSHIREVDAIVHVVRCFENENITHISSSINPITDIETINTELRIADLEILQNKVDNLQKKIKIGDKEIKAQLEITNKLIKKINNDEIITHSNWSNEQLDYINQLNLITIKPMLYICNVEEDSISTGNKFSKKVEIKAMKENSQTVIVSAVLESQITEFNNQEDKKTLLKDLNLTDTGLQKIIYAGYNLLNLITFFTYNPKETRAWTIPIETNALTAAGKIHTDFEKGFIRAETIAYDDFINLKGELACREAGKLRQEGKDYIVKDGDILHFLFNV